MEHYNHPPQPMKASTQAAVLGVLVLVFVGYAGNFHFLHGSDIALRKIPKVSWSLSETFINADEVRRTPVGMLRVKYPLFVAAGEALN